jgi:hypothetical protein
MRLSCQYVLSAKHEDKVIGQATSGEKNEKWEIGRNAQWKLLNDDVGRRHAQISWDAEDLSFQIQDLGSQNGTLCKQGYSCKLFNKCIIEMGDIQYQIEQVSDGKWKIKFYTFLSKPVERFEGWEAIIKDGSTIGRGTENDASIEDSQLDLVHAYFFEEDRQLTITCLDQQTQKKYLISRGV